MLGMVMLEAIRKAEELRVREANWEEKDVHGIAVGSGQRTPSRGLGEAHPELESHWN